MQPPYELVNIVSQQISLCRSGSAATSNNVCLWSHILRVGHINQVSTGGGDCGQWWDNCRKTALTKVCVMCCACSGVLVFAHFRAGHGEVIPLTILYLELWIVFMTRRTLLRYLRRNVVAFTVMRICYEESNIKNLERIIQVNLLWERLQDLTRYPTLAPSQ